MDAGMKGEQAGTTLRMALIRLSDAPEEASKKLTQMGIDITDAAGNMLPFDNIVQQLAESTKGMGNAAKLASLSTIFGAEAASGMLTIIDAGPEKLRAFTAELENSEGAAKKAADVMKDNLKGAVEQLSGAFETILITMGTTLTPVIQALTVALTGLLDWFNGLPSSVQTAITVLLAVTAAIALIAGPIMILISFIPAITAGFAAIAGAVGVTSGVLLSTIGIVFGVIAALAAIGVALVVAYNKVGWFRDMVDGAWANIKQAWHVALKFISDIVKSVMGAIGTFIGGKLTQIKALWNENGEAIMTLVKLYFEIIKSYITVVMNVIKGIFQVVWPIIVGVIKVAWALIQTTIGTAIDLIIGAINIGMKLLQGDWSGAWTAIKDTAKTIMENVIGYFKGIDLRQIGKDIIQGLINGISSMASAAMDAAKNIAAKVKEAVTDFLDINSPSRVMVELGAYTGEGFALGLAEQVNAIKSASRNLASAAVPTASSLSYSGTDSPGTSIKTGDTYGDIYVTIPADNIKEFNDITSFFGQLRQTKRARG